MTKTTTAARAELLAEFKERETTLVRVLSGLQNVLLGTGHIVECDGVYLTFDTTGGKATSPRACHPEKCVRFSQADAQRVAAEVTNGRHVQGQAMHVREAVTQDLQELRGLIGSLSKFPTSEESNMTKP